jgi:hypothetical protein
MTDQQSENKPLVEPLTVGDCKIEWVDQGLGQNGVFNPDDPNDMQLLTFNVYFQDQLLVSVKSQTGLGQPEDILLKLQEKIAERFANSVNSLGLKATEDSEFKMAVDDLTWIGPEWTFEW